METPKILSKDMKYRGKHLSLSELSLLHSDGTVTPYEVVERNRDRVW